MIQKHIPSQVLKIVLKKQQQLPGELQIYYSGDNSYQHLVTRTQYDALERAFGSLKF